MEHFAKSILGEMLNSNNYEKMTRTIWTVHPKVMEKGSKVVKLESCRQTPCRDNSVRMNHLHYIVHIFGFCAKMQESMMTYVFQKYLLKFLTSNGMLFVFPRRGHGVVIIYWQEGTV